MGRHIESLIINQQHLTAPKTNVERSGGRQHLVKVLQELVGSCPGAAAMRRAAWGGESFCGFLLLLEWSGRKSGVLHLIPVTGYVLVPGHRGE